MFDPIYKTENLEHFQPAHFTSEGAVSIDGRNIPYRTVCEDNVFYHNDGKLINGWYDICTQIGMVYYLVNHAYLPKDRTFVKAYPSGHMVYIGEDNVQAVTDDITTFVTGGDPTKN